MTTTKFISLVTGIVFLDVYLRSQLYSNDPLFLFASSNIFINGGLFLIVSLMIGLSFRREFKRWWSYAGCAGLAVLCGTLGVIGTFFSNILYTFPQILLPLDYMFLMEAGVVFGICALSYRHQEVPYKLSLPSAGSILNKFAFPVPKIPQSPNRLGRAS